ncbi:hypothetical protein AVEN_15569-1 [Araneus ventricosus]|uniref:Uncharacterized protein n=1 Tax=Araneus ventricosus TaxID=182803 RepID=A0A4Y2FV25_ARAVE|nr:hypothetical protein AVEN_15569-1 [Araneus ventricosus]
MRRFAQRSPINEDTIITLHITFDNLASSNWNGNERLMRRNSTEKSRKLVNQESIILSHPEFSSNRLQQLDRSDSITYFSFRQEGQELVKASFKNGTRQQSVRESAIAIESDKRNQPC